MTAPAPKVTRAPVLPLIWIVPLAALCVGTWMIYRELGNRGPEITIAFSDASDVEAGRTVLEHKGVAIGTVEAVRLKKDLSGVTISLRLNNSAAAVACQGSEFWIVHPEVGFSGVSGLETLVSGVRLNVRPGHGAPQTVFTGLDEPPPPDAPELGRAFILRSDRLGALTSGAPVYYREIKVGSVEVARLSDDATSVIVRIRILAPYADLVRTNTKFWDAGGINLKIGLLGAEMKSTSIESLLAGGVAFATPDAEPMAAPAKDGDEFALNDDADKAWLAWRPKIPIRPPETAPQSLKPGEGAAAAFKR